MVVILFIKDNVDVSVNWFDRLKNKKFLVLFRILVVDDNILDILENIFIYIVDYVIRDDIFIEILVEGDGNCFYRCIVYNFYDN